MTEHTLNDVEIGEDSIIQHPCEFENRKRMWFGKHVRVRAGGWFDVSEIDEQYKWQIVIGDGVALGRDNQISTSSMIVIEPFVMTASNVHIATQTHNYEDIDKPIMYQGATDSGPIVLHQGCWIGRNSLIFASVGMGSVVAGNSFVNKDVPDYCVVAGNPAKIIKKYSHEEKKWLRCV